MIPLTYLTTLAILTPITYVLWGFMAAVLLAELLMIGLIVALCWFLRDNSEPMVFPKQEHLGPEFTTANTPPHSSPFR